jgi:hypothetical protein
MKCSHCHKKIINELSAILVNSDEDFVCSKECKKNREQEMDHFFNEVLPDDKQFADWLGIPEEWVWNL